MSHIKPLLSMMKGKGTLVYVYAPWCGACREFDSKVMNHVQSLKNKTVNIAKVDSKYASKTGLPPVKFLPSLMYVKNGRAETFTGEDGTATSIVPRGKSLDEERESLTNFVQNSNSSPNVLTNANSQENINQSNRPNTLISRPRTARNRSTIPSATPGVMNLPSYNKEGSPGRSTVTLKSLAKSPYDAQEELNGMPTAEMSKNTMFTPIKSTIKASIPVSNPSDIGADLVASQNKGSFSKGPASGGMLSAIRDKVNSLNSLTSLRNTRRK